MPLPGIAPRNFSHATLHSLLLHLTADITRLQRGTNKLARLQVVVQPQISALNCYVMGNKLLLDEAIARFFSSVKLLLP
jgi:hypothetical protein